MKKQATPKELSPEAAMEKARRYCNYQERCTSEVLQRLKDWNVTGAAAEKIVNDLREEELLDDERFAAAFARGKFRIKGWGIAKIQNGLRAKNISNDSIAAALQALPQQELNDTLQRLLEKKNAQLKEPNPSKRKAKIANYAMQKGYRGDAVWKAIDRLLSKK